MWLATLAEARPSDGADIGDPAGDAVERFLKWEDDPASRRIAIDRGAASGAQSRHAGRNRTLR